MEDSNKDNPYEKFFRFINDLNQKIDSLKIPDKTKDRFKKNITTIITECNKNPDKFISRRNAHEVKNLCKRVNSSENLRIINYPFIFSKEEEKKYFKRLELKVKEIDSLNIPLSEKEKLHLYVQQIKDNYAKEKDFYFKSRKNFECFPELFLKTKEVLTDYNQSLNGFLEEIKELESYSHNILIYLQAASFSLRTYTESCLDDGIELGKKLSDLMRKSSKKYLQ